MPSPLALRLAEALEAQEWIPHDAEDREAVADLLDRAGLAEYMKFAEKAYYSDMGNAQNADAWERQANRYRRALERILAFADLESGIFGDPAVVSDEMFAVLKIAREALNGDEDGR